MLLLDNMLPMDNISLSWRLHQANRLRSVKIPAARRDVTSCDHSRKRASAEALRTTPQAIARRSCGRAVLGAIVIAVQNTVFDRTSGTTRSSLLASSER
jgi:hypothetical protein